jgi:hypothetical protein
MRHRLSRLIARVRATWAEMDYAQRRLLEIRTGLDLGARRDYPPPRPSAP